MKPDFEIRAVQLDLARQMETMDFIKKLSNGYMKMLQMILHSYI